MDFDADQIIAEFEKKVGKLKCPVCGNFDFQLANGFTRRDLSGDLDKLSVGGFNIPSISIICNNCGYILDFSLGIWDLIKKEGEE
jgi:predicted nucleic-acid-binding Zn-ribbon protein